MDVPTITMPKDKALQAYREYRDNLKTAQDHAIMLGYKAMAQGKSVINARIAVLKAGFDDQLRPLLAFARADAARQGWYTHSSGGYFEESPKWRFDFTVPEALKYKTHRAMVPLIPPHIRPGQTQLRHYWILWEADWKEAPRDPLLLKHLTGDLYVVLAHWDLTDLERAAMGVLGNGRR